MQLQVERRCEKGCELRGERRSRRDEAERLQRNGDEEGEESPEGDAKGQKGAWAGQEELETLAKSTLIHIMLHTNRCTGLSSAPFS